MTAPVRVPRAMTCAPVNVATSIIPSNLFLLNWAFTIASARTKRPSASGLRTSTVFPPKIVMTSLGRVAVSLGIFSARGAQHSIATGKASSAIARVAAHTAAAPLISHFIASIPKPGLRLSPPVSNVIPLPTNAKRLTFLAFGV